MEEDSRSGACFICQKAVSQQGNRLQETALSLKNIFGYLQIDAVAILLSQESSSSGNGNFLRGSWNEEGIASAICANCAPFTNLFGTFLNQRTSVETSMKECVEMLVSRIKAHSPSPSGAIGGLASLKAEVLKMCELKLKAKESNDKEHQHVQEDPSGGFLQLQNQNRMESDVPKVHSRATTSTSSEVDCHPPQLSLGDETLLEKSRNCVHCGISLRGPKFREKKHLLCFHIHQYFPGQFDRFPQEDINQVVKDICRNEFLAYVADGNNTFQCCFCHASVERQYKQVHILEKHFDILKSRLENRLAGAAVNFNLGEGITERVGLTTNNLQDDQSNDFQEEEEEGADHHQDESRQNYNRSQAGSVRNEDESNNYQKYQTEDILESGSPNNRMVLNTDTFPSTSTQFMSVLQETQEQHSNHESTEMAVSTIPGPTPLTPSSEVEGMKVSTSLTDVIRAYQVVNSDFLQNRPYYKTQNVKPPYTYAFLIGKAIRESPNRKLTANAIFAWFQVNFLWVRKVSKSRGQRVKKSIREMLSKKKGFLRKESNGEKGFWGVSDKGYYQLGTRWSRKMHKLDKSKYNSTNGVNTTVGLKIENLDKGDPGPSGQAVPSAEIHGDQLDNNEPNGAPVTANSSEVAAAQHSVPSHSTLFTWERLADSDPASCTVYLEHFNAAFNKVRNFLRTTNLQPEFSHDFLILQAISESPKELLKTREICDWYLKNFCYYRRWDQVKLRKTLRRVLKASNRFDRVDAGKHSRGWKVNAKELNTYRTTESIKKRLRRVGNAWSVVSFAD